MTQVANVEFLQVRSAQDKLRSICAVVQEHFFKKERVLIRVPTLDAAHFLDQLLWSQSPESFLPHHITDHESQEPIVITTDDKNLNKANILVHLCPEPSHIAPAFDKVYDLMDASSPQRLEQSQRRLKAYEDAHALV